MNNYKILPIIMAVLVLGGQALAANQPPVIEPVGTLEAVFGQPLKFTLRASDPDGDRVYFSAENLPDNATFYPGTGYFRWSPRLDQLGDHDFHFVATDSGDPLLSTGETVTVHAVYRVVERSKGFGLLGQERVAAEAHSLEELYPRVARIWIDGNEVPLGSKMLVVSELPVVELEIASPFRVDPASLTVSLNGQPVGLSVPYNVKTVGGPDNIISLRCKLDRFRFEHRTAYNLAVRAGNELGATRASWQLVMAEHLEGEIK